MLWRREYSGKIKFKTPAFCRKTIFGKNPGFWNERFWNKEYDLILVTGASGKTGKTIVRKLADLGLSVRAVVRNETQVDGLIRLGASEVMIAELRDAYAVNTFFQGTEQVYHICPNMSPDEEMIGQYMIEAARKNNCRQFVYHSVLHPQVEAMPHHWHKMRVEEKLLQSNIPFTILQPAAYMQNILGYWEKMMRDGIYEIPYSIKARSSMIDLNDLAEVVIKVLTNDSHINATYQLCGCEQLSAEQIVEIISKKSGKEIVASALDRNAWEKMVRAQLMPDFAVTTLLKMFEYYEKYDFLGNCNQLTWLLGRTPNDFGSFIENFLDQKSAEGN